MRFKVPIFLSFQRPTNKSVLTVPLTWHGFGHVLTCLPLTESGPFVTVDLLIIVGGRRDIWFERKCKIFN